MPYARGFLNALYARANGKKLKDKHLNRISPEKARAMIAEAKGKALSK